MIVSFSFSIFMKNILYNEKMMVWDKKQANMSTPIDPNITNVIYYVV